MQTGRRMHPSEDPSAHSAPILVLRGQVLQRNAAATERLCRVSGAAARIRSRRVHHQSPHVRMYEKGKRKKELPPLLPPLNKTADSMKVSNTFEVLTLFRARRPLPPSFSLGSLPSQDAWSVAPAGYSKPKRASRFFH